MKRIRFSAAYPERLRHPLHDVIVGDSPVRRAELLMWSPTADATTLLWFDGDRDATAAALDALDSLVASSLLSDADGTYAFLRQDAYEFPAALLDTVAASRVIFLPPVVAALFSTTVAQYVIPGSDALASWILLDLLGSNSIAQFLEAEFELEGPAYIIMWLGFSFPLGWLLGTLVTLADLVRPTE